MSDREPIIHPLKTWPTPYEAVVAGLKTYEIRVADRDFQVGDYLDLLEWHPDRQTFTGRHAVRRITYITRPGEWGLPENICVIGVKP